MSEKDKVLSQIRNLLAMANDERGNENERETAMRMAHRLLVKHGISLLDVENSLRDKEDPRDCFTSEGWSMRWTMQIRNSIAKLFMCSYFYGAKVNGTRCLHNFVGRESNAIAAEYISSYLIANILKEGRRLYKHNLSKETRAFATGCQVRIHQRVTDLIAEKFQETEMVGKELAVVAMRKQEADANESFIKSSGTSLVTKKSRQSSVDQRAFNNGFEYGGKLGLDVQIARPDEQLTLPGAKS